MNYFVLIKTQIARSWNANFYCNVKDAWWPKKAKTDTAFKKLVTEQTLFIFPFHFRKGIQPTISVNTEKQYEAALS